MPKIYPEGNYIIIEDGATDPKPQDRLEFIEDPLAYYLVDKKRQFSGYKILKSEAGNWDDQDDVAYTESTLRSMLAENTGSNKKFTLGNALFTDGSDDYASRVGPLGNNASKMTISCWLNPTTGRTFLGSRTALTNQWLLTNNTPSNFLPIFRNGNSNIATVAISGDYNQWSHYFVVYDGTEAEADRIKVWVNGTERTVVISGGTVPTSLSATAGENFEIGGATTAPIFDAAKYNEVGVWEGLAGTEADALFAYNDGKGNDLRKSALGKPTSYYDMNKNDGATSIPDKGTAGQDLTLNNFSTPPAYLVPHE